LENYYTIKSTLPDGVNTVPDILWNGNQFEDARAFKQMFLEDMPKLVFFDIHTVDCQVLNPKWDPAAIIKPEKNISIMVMTNGHVRLEDRKTGPLKEFSETFVLVPNIDKFTSGKGAMAERRNWLIQTQNFRYVVHHDPVTMEGQVAMDMA
jgi:NTF2-related export protein 1/2